MSRCAVVLIAAAGLVSTRPLQAQRPASQPHPPSQLSSRNEIYRARIEFAASESITSYQEWLGPAARANGVVDSTKAALNLPWRSAPPSMDVESQVAYGLARAWWPEWMMTGELAPIADGLAWYLQSRVVERLFDFTFHVPGHSAEGVRFFGGAVPWSFPTITVGRWTAGLGRVEFLRGTNGGRRPHSTPRKVRVGAWRAGFRQVSTRRPPRAALPLAPSNDCSGGRSWRARSARWRFAHRPVP